MWPVTEHQSSPNKIKSNQIKSFIGEIELTILYQNSTDYTT